MTTTPPADPRLVAPAAARNRIPIRDVLLPRLPAAGLVLEVASGSGEHICHFATERPDLSWQPSDPSATARQSIAAWATAEGLENIRQPLDLDAASPDWPIDAAQAIMCINMIHISPWQATEGLMRGAARILPANGLLYLYGPFRRADRPTAASNEAFDRDLMRRNPTWGLRDLEAVAACAGNAGLQLEDVIDMPANNLSVIFRRR